MAVETVEQIIARLRIAYPPPLYVEENGVRRQMTTEEYEAELARWAQNEHDQQLADAAEEARREIRRGVRRALTILNGPNGNDGDINRLEANTNMTTNQLRQHLLRTDKILEGMIQAMVTLNLLEQD